METQKGNRKKTSRYRVGARWMGSKRERQNLRDREREQKQIEDQIQGGSKEGWEATEQDRMGKTKEGRRKKTRRYMQSEG
jgi:hypothetical protein